MRWIVAGGTILANLALAAWADTDWQKMSGVEISTALTEQTVVYESARQVFYASGRTLYTTSEDSWGTWAVRGDRYCSQWPPNADWACYEMYRMGETLKWTDTWGSESIGTLTVTPE